MSDNNLKESEKFEEELRKSEEMFKLLAEQSLMGIILIQDGKIIYTNQPVAVLMDTTIQDIMSWSASKMFDYIHPDYRGDVMKKIAERTHIMESDKADRIQDELVTRKIITPSGKMRCILSNVKVFELNGKPTIQGIFLDITEQNEVDQKLKVSERKFRELFNNMSSGVAVYDVINEGKDFIFKDFNLAGERIENIKKEDLIGKNVLKIFPSVRSFGLFDVFQRVWKSGNPENHPITLYEDKRIKGWRENYVYKLPSGEIVAIYDDITERKKIEIEREEALRQTEFYKDLFAHDMNNILQCIISSAEYYSLIRNDPEKIKDLGDIAEVVKKHALRGAKLISNIRKLSKLDETEAQLNAIEIFNMLNQSVKHAVSGFQERNVKIKIRGLSEDIKVLGNELLIDIFDNVLNNAVKYNDNKEEVKIKVNVSKILENDTQYIEFKFIDYGMGVPEGNKKDLFNRSYTEDVSKRGMGIGLSLVKKIVDKYSGKIRVEDRVKGDYTKGSNFIVLLKEAF